MWREHRATRLQVLPRVSTYKPHCEASQRRKDNPGGETYESLQAFRSLVSALLKRDNKQESYKRGDDVGDGLQGGGDLCEEILRYEVPHVTLSPVSMQTDRQKDGAYPERGANEGRGGRGSVRLPFRKMQCRDDEKERES